MEFAWEVKEMCPRVYCAWNNFLPIKNIEKCENKIFTSTFDFLGVKKNRKKTPIKKNEEDGRPKKKKKMGGRWASRGNPPIKKKEDGRPKKKTHGETPPDTPFVYHPPFLKGRVGVLIMVPMVLYINLRFSHPTSYSTAFRAPHLYT